jgi:hypothetical protein
VLIEGVQSGVTVYIHCNHSSSSACHWGNAVSEGAQRIYSRGACVFARSIVCVCVRASVRLYARVSLCVSSSLCRCAHVPSFLCACASISVCTSLYVFSSASACSSLSVCTRLRVRGRLFVCCYFSGPRFYVRASLSLSVRVFLCLCLSLRIWERLSLSPWVSILCVRVSRLSCAHRSLCLPVSLRVCARLSHAVHIFVSESVSVLARLYLVCVCVYVCARASLFGCARVCVRMSFCTRLCVSFYVSVLIPPRVSPTCVPHLCLSFSLSLRIFLCTRFTVFLCERLSLSVRIFLCLCLSYSLRACVPFCVRAPLCSRISPVRAHVFISLSAPSFCVSLCLLSHFSILTHHI